MSDQKRITSAVFQVLEAVVCAKDAEALLAETPEYSPEFQRLRMLLDKLEALARDIDNRRAATLRKSRLHPDLWQRN